MACFMHNESLPEDVAHVTELPNACLMSATSVLL